MADGTGGSRDRGKPHNGTGFEARDRQTDDTKKKQFGKRTGKSHDKPDKPRSELGSPVRGRSTRRESLAHTEPDAPHRTAGGGDLRPEQPRPHRTPTEVHRAKAKLGVVDQTTPGTSHTADVEPSMAERHSPGEPTHPVEPEKTDEVRDSEKLSIEEWPAGDKCASEHFESAVTDTKPSQELNLPSGVRDESIQALVAPEIYTPPVSTPPVDEATTRTAETALAASDCTSEGDAVTASETPQESAAAPKSAKMTLADVALFADFLQFLIEIEGDFKPVDLPKSSPVRLSMAKSMDLTQFDDEVADIAARDIKLTTALSLLISSDRSDLTGFSRQNINELAARILRRHPAFSNDNAVRDRLTRLLSGDADDLVLSLLITRLRNRLDGDFDGKANLKASGLAALQDNATHAVILITASAANWDQLTLVNALAEHMWDAGSWAVGSPAHREKLVTIPKASRKVTALLVDTFRARVRAVEDDLAAETFRLTAARVQNDRLTASLAESIKHAEGILQELADVRSELQAEIASRKSEKMANTTDFETLRVDTAQNIAKQVESLEDALDALEHGQSQVTDEFVRRAVHNLQRSLAKLQPRTTQDSKGEQA